MEKIVRVALLEVEMIDVSLVYRERIGKGLGFLGNVKLIIDG